MRVVGPYSISCISDPRNEGKENPALWVCKRLHVSVNLKLHLMVIVQKPASEPVFNNALCKSFIAALLATGNVDKAELAVLEGISESNASSNNGDTLFAGTLKAAIAQPGEVWDGSEEIDRASSILPFELRRVLRLVPNLRHCFVCRVLAGFSREVCASLLHLEVRQLDESTSAAVRKLASIASREGAEQQRFFTLTDLESDI